MLRILLTFTALIVSMAVVAPGAMAFSKKSLVWDKCTDCHEPRNGKIPRVEEIRTTPEEWTVIVDRMARLHGMGLAEGEIVTLVKELCETQILTPEESAGVAYLDLLNNPQHVEVMDEGEGQYFATCVRCHSSAKIKSYRMNKDSWAKVRNLHYYVDPPIDSQMREMRWYDESAAVLEGLAKTLPYGKAWKAPKASPAGSWIVLGNEPGRGDYHGEVTLKDAGKGDFTVSGKVTFEDGLPETIQGDAILFGGSQLRTYVKHSNQDVLGAYVFTDGVINGQHHYPAPAYRNSTSTWYPADGKSQVYKVSPSFLLAGEETTLTLQGVKLSKVKASDLSFAGGKVDVLSAKLVDGAIVARVINRGNSDVQTKLKVKSMGSVVIALADKIDYIAVGPILGRARVNGGENYPAEGVQFVATAYAKGAKSDDVLLGTVPAHFELSEWKTRDGDDDLVYIGGISANGTFVPSGDYGPVHSRQFRAGATGLVQVNATYQRGSDRYAAEARLAVVPPDFVPRIK
jgi:quinohemoprotein amine dehydrogenase